MNQDDRRRYARRAQVKHLGGTVVEYTCAAEGHVWKEDLGRKSLPPPRRLSALAVTLLLRSWTTSGLTVACPKCVRKIKLSQEGR